ncbi:MAG: HD-GYP domain-containing protein, partial [Thermoleophilia bacterium]|nr:HD-GYP domain-containing protein [Thermoleophilia bacterium]
DLDRIRWLKAFLLLTDQDEETGAHIAAMSGLCAALALRLGWPRERAGALGLAGALHDVGKIAVPDEILHKPGALAPHERMIVETHAQIGHDMLAGSGDELLDLAATIALTHHERMDGTGYPRGLRGEAIPVEGRIAAVADVFEALTSDRCYRRALPLRRALGIMEEGRGGHFDPRVLDALLAEVAEGTALAEAAAAEVRGPGAPASPHRRASAGAP